MPTAPRHREAGATGCVISDESVQELMGGRRCGTVVVALLDRRASTVTGGGASRARASRLQLMQGRP
jgi:hypothetical protein